MNLSDDIYISCILATVVSLVFRDDQSTPLLKILADFAKCFLKVFNSPSD